MYVCTLYTVYSMCVITHVAVRAVVLAAFDLVQVGVREVELLCVVVYGQAGRFIDVAADDRLHVGAAQC